MDGSTRPGRGGGPQEPGTNGPGTNGPGDGAPAPGGDAPAPASLLSDLSRLRRQARTARHAYWFPLVLFGLLICAAAPLYVAANGPSGTSAVELSSPATILGGMPGPAGGTIVGWYWAGALVAGYLLTVGWYWLHARRAGLKTPSRGYLLTGAALVALTIALPWLTREAPALSRVWIPAAGIWMRGTVAFLIIAAGLWVLARAERSRALALIALIYTGAALLVSLYNVENVVFDLGWDPGSSQFAWRLSVLPDVLLPALVLLAAGGGAFLAQHKRALR